MQPPSGNKPRDFTRIDALIRDFMKSCRQSPDVRMTRVWEIWDSAVDPFVAENAQPVAFKGGMLFVNVSSSPMLQQTRFMEQQLIDAVNTALGETIVTDIRFKIGPLS